MEEPGEKPPAPPQPLPEGLPPQPSPASAPFYATRRGLLRQQAARMKKGKSLSPRFLASNTSKLPSKGRKSLTSIPETRAIRQRLTYGALSESQGLTGEKASAAKQQGGKKRGKGKSLRDNSKAPDCEGIPEKKEVEEEAFVDCLEEDVEAEAVIDAEKTDMLILEGNCSTCQLGEPLASIPSSSAVVDHAPASVPKEANEKSTLLTVASLNKKTKSISPKAGYKQSEEGGHAEDILVVEQYIQTNGLLESQQPLSPNMERAPVTHLDQHHLRGDLGADSARELDAAQPLQPPRRPHRNPSDTVSSENRGGQSDYEISFPPLKGKGPTTPRANSIKDNHKVNYAEQDVRDTNVQNMDLDGTPARLPLEANDKNGG